ncbi:hypothetical protein VTJ49DRAFT_4828 [Mycothermus thermophilus]|uniref:DUF6604 domain-containing protein n=1 Tax=Humicola insolens TaxID=85995 RepID=A0ABR3V5E9_HUMIN
MFPGPLVSIYQQYKQDTDAVASWLASTARALGYPGDLLASKSWDAPPPAPARSGRLKGKAREQVAGAPKKYIVAIADILPLAKFIAGKLGASTAVPDSFARTIDRLIAARASFANRLNEHGAKVDKQANARHGYFVGILEEVRDALRPHMSTKVASATAAASKTSATDALANRFEALKVSEPSDDFLKAPVVERPEPAGGDKTVYEAEPQVTFEDAMFAMSTVINDLNKIRAVIEWTWANYRDNIFDLCAAAVATNTAAELARGVMEDAEAIFERQGGFWRVMSLFYHATGLARGVPKDVMGAVLRLENAHTDLTYKLADDLCVTAHRLLVSFKHVLQPGAVPVIKDGHWATYVPESYHRRRKTGREMANDDKIITCEFLTELMIVVRAVPDYPVQNEFLRGMKEMEKTGKVSFALTFAAQVFLDIHHTLRDKADTGAGRLFEEMGVMERELRKHFAFHQNLKLSPEAWPATDEEAMRQLLREITALSKDPVYVEKERLVRLMGKSLANTVRPHRILEYSPVLSGLLLFRLRYRMHQVGIAVADAWGSIQYSTHLYHALMRRQLLRGPWLDMVMAHSMLRDESFFMGISVAALSGPPSQRRKVVTGGLAGFASNAGPRRIREDSVPVSEVFGKRLLSGTGQPEWTAEQIDEVISRSEFHVEEVEGGERILVTQMSDDEVVEKKKKKNKHNNRRKKKDNGGEKEEKAEVEENDEGPTPPADAATVGDDDNDNDNTPADANDAQTTSKNKKRNRKKPKKKKQPSSSSSSSSPAHKPVSLAELAKSLTTALHAETISLVFPYLSLHRSCWQRLREIRAACDPLLRERFTPAYMEKETELPWVVGYIFLAAADPVVVAGLTGDGMEGNLLGGGRDARRDLRLLSMAAEVINGLVGTGKLTEALAVLREMRHNVEFEGLEEGMTGGE